jgi:hypothetical protein
MGCEEMYEIFLKQLNSRLNFLQEQEKTPELFMLNPNDIYLISGRIAEIESTIHAFETRATKDMLIAECQKKQDEKYESSELSKLFS